MSTTVNAEPVTSPSDAPPPPAPAVGGSDAPGAAGPLDAPAQPPVPAPPSAVAGEQQLLVPRKDEGIPANKVKERLERARRAERAEVLKSLGLDDSIDLDTVKARLEEGQRLREEAMSAEQRRNEELEAVKARMQRDAEELEAQRIALDAERKQFKRTALETEIDRMAIQHQVQPSAVPMVRHAYREAVQKAGAPVDLGEFMAGLKNDCGFMFQDSVAPAQTAPSEPGPASGSAAPAPVAAGAPAKNEPNVGEMSARQFKAHMAKNYPGFSTV